MKLKYLYIFFLLFSLNCFSQGVFKLSHGVKRQVIKFKLKSNLVILPIEVNGVKLNFILDSGVGNTILFNINPSDSLKLRNVKKIKLRGLGGEDAVDAILSKGNRFKTGAIFSNNQKVYVVSNNSFDLSSKMGITIHGIIGYGILKDFVIRINYHTKKLTFYNPKTYKYKKCNKCETFNLQFYKRKPYIDVGVKLDSDSDKITPVKLLIDSGGSDAMWLFENSHPDIISPINYFDDFLGEGLSGVVYGKRSKIKSLVLGKFELKNPTVSYPDSISVSHALKFLDRNGSLGANVLKRFQVIFDYGENKMTLKKSASFKEPFRYNMSGIELVYNGKVLVKEVENIGSVHISETTSNNSTGNKISFETGYKYTFKPTYKIHKVQKGSPAYIAGLEAGDVVLKINGKYTYNLKLEDIVHNFYKKEHTKINLVIERNGKDYQYRFRLRDMLK